MQHVGHRSLADGLACPRRTRNEPRALRTAALHAYRRFHSVTQRFGPMLRALAHQSDLDRITRRTLERRYASAFVRLPDPTASPAPTASPRRTAPAAPWDLVDTLIKPLLSSPRRIVHNGFSPLNLIWNDDRLVVIDWETLAVAPPEIDFADLLTFPDWDAPERMAAPIRPPRSSPTTACASTPSGPPPPNAPSLTPPPPTSAATASASANPVLARRLRPQRLPRYLDWFHLAAAELIRDHATAATACTPPSPPCVRAPDRHV